MKPKKMPLIGNCSQCPTSEAGKVYKVVQRGITPTVCAGTHGYAMWNILEEQVHSKEQIFCQLNKIAKGKNTFKSLHDATVMNVGGIVAGTLTARYYKGVAGNGDPMVIEVVYESDSAR